MEWKPTKKQIEALKQTNFECLYGGARGGGKTDTGIVWLKYDIDNYRYRALVIRKNSEDLKDWVDRARRMYAGTGCEITSQPPMFRFPSGAIIYTGHLKDDNSYTKYQGHEYHRMLIEELTQIPSEELYLKLIASCRSTVEGLPARVLATANPGGLGHRWVKERFVNVTKPNTVYKDDGRSRIFIPATVDDNPYLMEKDPDYVKFLDSLPPDLKAQWRHGEWDSVQFKGQVYGEEMAEAKDRIYEFAYDKNRHVNVAMDIGLNDAMALTFFQEHGELIKVIDYHEESNKAWAYYSTLMKDKGYNYGTIFLPHDGKKRSQDTLTTLEDILQNDGFNVRVLKRTDDILADIQLVKVMFNRMHFIASKTQELLDSIEQYRFEWDERRGIAKNKPVHDWSSHANDSMRYMCCAIRDYSNTEDSKSMDEYINTNYLNC